MHQNSRRFHQLLRELGELHDRKQDDYGRSDDPFVNVRAAEDFGVRPWVGTMIRLNDKVRRLQTFARTGKLKNEGAKDSMRDIAVYAIISLVLFELEEEHEHREARSKDRGTKRSRGWRKAAAEN